MVLLADLRAIEGSSSETPWAHTRHQWGAVTLVLLRGALMGRKGVVARLLAVGRSGVRRLAEKTPKMEAK